MRFLKLFAWLLFTVVLCITFLFVYIATPSGTTALFRLAERYVPGKLTIQAVHGSIFQHFKLTQIHYSNTKTQFDADTFELTWQPAKLLQGQFYIDHAALLHTNLKVQPAKEVETHRSQGADFSVFKRLKHIAVQQLMLKDFKFAGSTVFQIKEAFFYPADEHNRNFYIDSDFMQLAGKIIWPDAALTHINITAKLQALNLGAFRADMPSHINANITVETELHRQRIPWHVQLNNVRGDIRNYALKGQIDLQGENDLFIVNEANLSLADATFKVQGTHQVDWQLHWQLNIPELNHLWPTAFGRVISSGNVIGKETDPNLDANILLTNNRFGDWRLARAAITANGTILENIQLQSHLQVSGLSNGSKRIPSADLTYSAQQKKKRLINQAALTIGANQIQASIVLPRFTNLSDMKQPIKGSGKIVIPQLEHVIGIMPQIESPRGQVQGEFSLSGSLQQPKLAAKLNLQNGRVDVPLLGLKLRGIIADLQYRDQAPLTFNASLQSGAGTLRAAGQGNLQNQAMSVNATLAGQNILVANTKEYRVVIDPDLKLQYQNNQLAVSGSVQIPEAKITPAQFSNVVTLTGDVRYADEASQSDAFENLNLDVSFQLGKKIYIAYDNLTTNLQGSLTIRQTPGSLPTGIGELVTVNGSYQAYGRNLTIDAGRLIFTGNALTNPGLDIKATRHVKTLGFASDQSQFNANANNMPSIYTGRNELAVGVIVRGTINKPRANLFSDPAGMNQNDILSYLLFGYPQSEITGASSLALLNSLSSSLHMGGDGNNAGFTDKLQNLFGLTEFSVGSTEYFNPETSETGNTTAVSIGKKLGKNLSLHYSIGLFYPVSILNIRYQINKYFALQSETSTIENGADILYEYEPK